MGKVIPILNFLDLKTKYEAEIIDRVAAENKVQGLEEQIALNNRMFEEIASSRVVTTTNDAEAVSILSFVPFCHLRAHFSW